MYIRKWFSSPLRTFAIQPPIVFVQNERLKALKSSIMSNLWSIMRSLTKVFANPCIPGCCVPIPLSWSVNAVSGREYSERDFLNWYDQSAPTQDKIEAVLQVHFPLLGGKCSLHHWTLNLTKRLGFIVAVREASTVKELAKENLLSTGKSHLEFTVTPHGLIPGGD